MKRAVIYARVSSRKQADEGISMDAQIEQCTARALALGATVVRVFRDDGVSGRSTKGRNGFQAALAYCEAAPVEYFITWSTSRFARNAIDLWVHQDQLKALGTRLECLNADIDDETDAGFINRVFMGAMDQMVSRQIARDTLRSMKKSASEGYFTGGRVPFGYRVEKVGKRGKLVPDEVEGPVVQRAFAMARSGLGGLAIALRLNESGVFRRGQPWRANTVLLMLKNQTYLGIRTFNRMNKRTGRDKQREEWVQIQSHPALIAQEVFDEVSMMMDDRKPAHRQPPTNAGGSVNSAFVFAGLLTCGICGGKLQVINGTSRNGTLYSYYACRAHRHGQARCLFRNVRADLFDDWLVGEVLARIVTPDVMAHAVQEITSLGSEYVRERAQQRAALVTQLRELERRRDGLYDLLETHGRDTPDLPDVTRRLRQRNAEISAVQSRLDGLDAEEPARQQAARIEPELATEVMREVIAAGDAQKKRAVMGAFLESITVSPGKVLIDYRADQLVRAGHPAGVRSAEYWLPDLGSNQGPAD